MRIDAVRLSCAGLIACLAVAQGASAGDPRARLARGDLFGTWQLAGMSYSGPNGTHADPFYQPDSTGLLIYDPSGWMSVQISAPRRPPGDIPATRAQPGEAAELARKASAFDTYYAYYGTWIFAEAGATVTHHVTGALIAAEAGRDYVQSVRLDHGRLVLTTRTGPPGQQTVREKFWNRAREP
jgi:Lipocalin-like domain